MSRFSHRDTHTRPTKSAVIGLCAAALGRDRTEAVDDLAGLAFGIRADHPGTPVRDYHSVGAGRFPLRPRDVITDHRRAAAVAKSMEAADGPSFGHHALADWYGAPKKIAADPVSGNLVSGELAQGDDHRALVPVGRGVRRRPPARRRGTAGGGRTRAGAPQAAAVARPEVLSALRHPRRGDPARHDRRGVRVQAPAARAGRPRHVGPKAVGLDPGGVRCCGAAPVNDQPVSFHPARRAHTTRWETRMRVTIAPTATDWDIIP